ncbi:MAG TPA: ATP-grasp domain-containing protein [Longimicrobiales bacterium]
MKVVVLSTHEPTLAEPDAVVPQVRAALERAGHDASHIEVATDVAAVVRALQDARPDLVFNLTEGFGGKSALDSNVAGLLNLLDLRYTGSSPSGLMLAGDKSLSKKVLGFHGVQTPDFATLYRGALDHADDLHFPLIVKPPQEDASIGVTTKSVVRDLKELLSRIDELQAAYRSPVLVERFIEGREFYVGVLGNAHAEALPVIELDFTGFPEHLPRVASFEAKWGEDQEGNGGARPEDNAEYAGTRSIFPTDLDPALEKRMQEVALDAFAALRLRDYARIDLRVTDDGEIYVIEVNPNCYLERSGEFARAAGKAGLEHDALIARIVELASGRYAR